jgi:hypothetical protein
MDEMRNAYRILARKPHRNRDNLGRPRHRWFSIGLGLGPTGTRFCEDSNETSGSIKGTEFPNQLNNNHTMKSSWEISCVNVELMYNISETFSVSIIIIP